MSKVFHILIDLSVEPPPVARRLLLWGDQAKALTAAVCWFILPMYFPILGYQMKTRLSLPPEASIEPSHDHFRPQIYCVCPSKRKQASFCLMSQMIISLSLEPEAI